MSQSNGGPQFHPELPVQVEEGQEAPVVHLSMLEVGGHKFLLKFNQAAVARVFAATRHASLAHRQQG